MSQEPRGAAAAGMRDRRLVPEADAVGDDRGEPVGRPLPPQRRQGRRGARRVVEADAEGAEHADDHLLVDPMLVPS